MGIELVARGELAMHYLLTVARRKLTEGQEPPYSKTQCA